MKIALTGAGGFLGARLLEFYRKDHSILVLGHEKIEEEGREGLRLLWERERPEALFHCAAISDTRRAEEDPELSRRANVELPVELARICGEYGTKMIFCSSDQVYFEDGREFEPGHYQPAEEEVKPRGLYGRQKLQAERGVLRECPEAVCLRLSWMYDRESRPGEHGTLLSAILQNIKEEKPMRYPVHDYRGITNVWEAVRNFQKAALLPGGVYNFGSPGRESTYMVVRELLKALDADLNMLEKNELAFADNPRNLRMSGKKAKRYGIFFSETKEGLCQAAAPRK